MSWRTSLGTAVQELRVQFGSTPASQGLRNFILKEYPAIKTANPKLPILIRESSKLQEPRLVARYDYGIERTVQCSNNSESEIVNKINELIQYAESLPKHNEAAHTQKQVTQ